MNGLFNDNVKLNFDANGKKTDTNNSNEENKTMPDEKVHRVRTWTEIRSSLNAIEDMMSSRVKGNVGLIKSEPEPGAGKQLPSTEEARPGKGASEEDSEEEFYDLERSESDPIQDIISKDIIPAPALEVAGHATDSETLPPWKEELECLVQGGVPMALRGEVK